MCSLVPRSVMLDIGRACFILQELFEIFFLKTFTYVQFILMGDQSAWAEDVLFHVWIIVPA